MPAGVVSILGVGSGTVSLRGVFVGSTVGVGVSGTGEGLGVAVGDGSGSSGRTVTVGDGIAVGEVRVAVGDGVAVGWTLVAIGDGVRLAGTVEVGLTLTPDVDVALGADDDRSVEESEVRDSGSAVGGTVDVEDAVGMGVAATAGTV